LARKTDPRAGAIFALSFNHGLRVTEVLNLRLDGDINWKVRTVRIARLKGTFVEFDHSLNAAIKRLRDTLGESAETPILVETLARRGYRFIAPVVQDAAPQSDAQERVEGG